MTREIIKEILNQYTVGAKQQFGESLKNSGALWIRAREDYDDESDID